MVKTNRLHIVGSFYPAIKFGGPIFSTKNIVENHLELYDTFVVTSNKKNPENNEELLSLADKQILNYSDKVSYRPVKSLIEKLRFIYFIFNRIKNTDVVYCTGFFNFYTLPTVLFCNIMEKKLVLLARGSLQALNEFENIRRKRLKKIFIFALNVLIKDKLSFWLATTDRELQINMSYIKLRGGVVTNPVPSVCIEDIEKRQEDMRIGFLSRLSAKKGLSHVFELIINYNFPVSIAGDGELSLVIEAQNLSTRGNCTYYGLLRNEDKKEFYLGHAIIVLPSYSENFGIAIAEALSHGCIVVTTVQHPWTDLCDSRSLWVTDHKSFSETVRNVYHWYETLTASDRKQVALNSKAIADDNFSLSKVKRALLRYEKRFL